jgi:hypothetical protein
MIKEVKLKKTKKIRKNGRIKNDRIKNHIKKHNNNLTRKISKKISKKLLNKLLRKSQRKSLTNPLRNPLKKSLLKSQDGGNTKERFEVKKLTDIDYSQFSLSKYVNQDIDWGTCPGPPPAPDCCIM